MKRIFSTLAWTAALHLSWLPIAHAHSPSPSEMSALASAGSVASVLLPVAVVGASVLIGASTVTVLAAEVVADGVRLTLAAAGQAAHAVVTITRDAARAAVLSAGTVLNVSVTTAGLLLFVGSVAVAFIPASIAVTLFGSCRYPCDPFAAHGHGAR